jgi:hypothetical protein
MSHTPYSNTIVPSTDDNNDDGTFEGGRTDVVPPTPPPPSGKQELITHIRAWIRVENEIKQLTNELKKRRELKQRLTGSLLQVMKSNDIDCFDVNNGQLIYSRTRVKAPLNRGQLLSALIKYYNDNDTAKEMSEFLLSERSEKVKEFIRMKLPKM